jgi:uncharacterized protein (TIGR02444 family)
MLRAGTEATWTMTPIKHDPTNDDPETECWRFCGALYAAPMISETALALQDRFGLAVNILLFSCWHATFSNGRLGETTFRRLIAASAPWREGVTVHLREARRSLPKDAPLRASLLETELAAERIEIAQLVPLAPPKGARAAPAAIAATALQNLETYLAATDTPLTESLHSALAHLARITASLPSPD